MPLVAKFRYLKELTQLISGISVVHTDMLRWMQYVDEIRAKDFKGMKRCHRYVPAAREKILYNCVERCKLLNDENWQQLKLDMLFFNDGNLEAPDAKYIGAQYRITYTYLASAREQCSRIIEFTQIVNALQDRNIANWCAFVAKVPKLIDNCYDNWASLCPTIPLVPQNPNRKPPPCVVPTNLKEWVDKVNYLNLIMQKGEPYSIDSSDSEDEGGFIAMEERKSILARGFPRTQP